MKKGMGKTLTLVVGMAVIMVAAVVVGSRFIGSVDALRGNTDDVKQSGCDYQRKQYLKPSTPSSVEISDRCESFQGALSAQKTRLSERIKAIRRLNQINENKQKVDEVVGNPNSCTEKGIQGSGNSPYLCADNGEGQLVRYRCASSASGSRIKEPGQTVGSYRCVSAGPNCSPGVSCEGTKGNIIYYWQQK
ncbi:MAG: hypothetical protein ABEK16_05230 [Candidatus Nanohalobium sp.]